MCTKLRSTRIGPGSIIPVRQAGGRSSSIWGFGNGAQYNARSERLGELYKNCIRGVILMDSFWESNREFVPGDRELFSIPVILNRENEFAVLTRDSNELVSHYHHRMPVLLNPDAEDEFLSGDFHTGFYLPEYLVTEKGVNITYSKAA